MNPGGKRGGKTTAPSGKSMAPSGPFKRIGASFQVKANSVLSGSGSGLNNTIRSRKARQSRVLGTSLTGKKMRVADLARQNTLFRNGYGRLNVKRNIGKAKRLNLI